MSRKEKNNERGFNSAGVLPAALYWPVMVVLDEKWLLIEALSPVSGFTACVAIVHVSTGWDRHSPDTIYTRGHSVWPLEVNSGLSVYAYMRNVLKCKYRCCCVDNCKRYNREAWWKCSLSPHQRILCAGTSERAKVLILKLKRPLLCLCISLTFTEK